MPCYVNGVYNLEWKKTLNLSKVCEEAVRDNDHKIQNTKESSKQLNRLRMNEELIVREIYFCLYSLYHDTMK